MPHVELCGSRKRKKPRSSACWDFCMFHPFRTSKNQIARQEHIPPSLGRAAVGRNLQGMGKWIEQSPLDLFPKPNTEEGNWR